MSRPDTSALFTATGSVITLGEQLGRGGEGVVYAIAGRLDQAAKIHSRTMPADLVEKLTLMTGRGGHGLANQVAWPMFTIHRGSPRGPGCGFVMPRVSGGVEIHRLYTLKDRREAFPGCNWAFLAATAKNCAAAFDDVHAAGCCVGDVNQKNILVMPDATVRILDCDSFQVTSPDGRVYSCPVGVPEFTPPELQGADLRRVPRTPDHDRFGLAVLIFHLLFLGRHPYAGIRVDGGENALAEAIRRHRFAYSRHSHSRGIAPPPNAPLLDVLPESLGAYFERAFSDPGARGPRPTAGQWREALDAFGSSLRACRRTPSHYRGRGKPCPWCEHAAAGIDYFPMDGDAALPPPPRPAPQRASVPGPASTPVPRPAVPAPASLPPPRARSLVPGSLLAAAAVLLILLLLGPFIRGERGALHRILSLPPASEPLREDLVGVFSGHQGTVFAVEFSGDGTRVLTNGLDGFARVWDVASRRELERRPLSGEVAAFTETVSNLGVQTVRLGPDSVGKEAYEKIWRQKLCMPIAEMRRTIEQMRADDRYTRFISLPPRDEAPPYYETVDRITSRVTMGRDGPFDVMRVPAPDDSAQLFFYYGGGVALELRRDGRRRVLVPQPDNAFTMAGAEPRVAAIAFSPGSSVVAVSRPRPRSFEEKADNSETTLWRGETGGRADTFVHAKGKDVSCLAFSPDGRYLAAGVGDQVELWRCR